MPSPPEITVLSAATELPGAAVDNAALAKLLGMPQQWADWVDTFVGTRTRHLAVDPASGISIASLADLGTEAARRALEQAGTTPADIGLVVMATAMPDTLIPTTVNVIADRLGIDGVPTYQLQSGCSGAFQALELAAHLLRGGVAGTALVIGGDRVTKHLDLGTDFAALPPAELVSVVMFGDGVGAAVLDARPGTERTGGVRVHHAFTRLTGAGRDPGHVLEWYGMADLAGDRPAFSREDYKQIEASVPAMTAAIVNELVEASGWGPAEFDYLMPPQLSGRMTERIVRELTEAGLSEAHEISCVRETGNVGNATPFFQLERLLRTMLPGERALGVSVESSKWIKAGLTLEKS
ncbi:3-oxoacyl-[acyl-carrier-protein] synthase-3 [Catenulispora sp. GAS73]|uniref:3-oxoacyl-ACP synthase III family protein n=1 Tax=Catenulispora sp. GAS73 TaxID=3156269 RepID=UPI003513A4AA